MYVYMRLITMHICMYRMMSMYMHVQSIYMHDT